MDKLVSVIITTHERDKNILKRAIDSVLCQSYSNIEIIVVNDAPDYSKRNDIEKLITSYSNIKYILNSTNPGACGSRNLGIKSTKGDIIALLDDDDTFEVNKIERMITYFENNVGLVYCNINQIQNGKNIKSKKLNFYENDAFEKLHYFNFIGGCSVPIMLKEVFEKVGYFDESLPSAQDIDMWIRIAEVYNVKYCNEFLVNYYISDIAITTNPDRRLNGWKIILNKYDDFFSKNMEAKSIWQNCIIELLLQHSRYREAITYYRNSYHGIEKLLQSKTILRGFAKNAQMKIGVRNR